jgi:hypothetical protein
LIITHQPEKSGYQLGQLPDPIPSISGKKLEIEKLQDVITQQMKNQRFNNQTLLNYPLVNVYITMENHNLYIMGKSTINGHVQ